MAFDVPDSLSESGAGLTYDGDVRLDAFSNQLRIVSLPDTVPLPAASLPEMPAGTVIANVTASTAVPTFHPLATMAGSGLTYTNITGVFDIGAGTGITVNANDVALAAIVDDSFLANVSGSSAAPTAKTFASLAGVALTYNATSHELDWDGLSVRKNSAGSVFTRRRVNLIEGSNVTITVADDAGDDEVDITIASTGGGGLSAIADQRVLGNDSGASATPTAITVHQELDWIGGTAQWIFDGVDDVVTIGDFLDFERTDAFSVTAWGYSTTAASGAFIAKQNDSASPGWRLASANAGTGFGFTVTNGTQSVQVDSTATFADGSEHFVAATYTGSSTAAGVVLYLDGVATAMTTILNNLVSGSSLNAVNLQLGKRGTSSSRSGGLRHVAVWDRVLTPSEIAEVYGGGTPPDLTALSFAGDLVGYWKLDSADATGAGNIIDYSSGNHDGTAGGGLAPTAAVGALPVRGGTFWQLVVPAASGLPLVSNGIATIPSYRQIDISALPSIADDSMLVNISGASAAPQERTLANMAGDGLVYDAVNHHWDVQGSTSIVITGDQVTRAALTGAITASANSNTTAFGALAAKSVLANSTNVSAVPAALAGSAAFQYLRVNSANTALEWATLSLASFPTMAAGSFLANVTGSTAVPTAHDLATFAGAGLTYTNVTGIMAVGAGTGITVNANDVQISAIAAESFFMNATAGSAVPTAVAGSTVAGAGLTYTTGGILAVGAGTGLTVNANDVQISAIAAESFFMNGTAGSAVPTAIAGSTVAGAGLTYSTGGILAVGAGTGITVNANDVAIADGDRGDITVSGSGATWTVDLDVISDTKLRNSGALSVIGRSANSSGDPADISAVAASGAVLRESGSTIGFGTIATAGFGDDQVNNAKLANMAEGTTKGRAIGAGTGDPTDLTGFQSAALQRYIVVVDTTTSGTTTNYAPTGFDTATTGIRISPPANLTIQGMTLAAGQQLHIRVGRSSTFTVTIEHESASATATDRFNNPNNVSLVLRAGEGCLIRNGESRNNVICVGRSTVADADYGDIVVSANGATWTIDTNSVSNTKLADMAANTIKANPTASTADPQDLAISADSLPARVGANLVSHPFSTLAGSCLTYSAGVINVQTTETAHVYVTTADEVGFRKSRQRHFWFEEFDWVNEREVATGETEIHFGMTTWGISAGGNPGDLVFIAAENNHTGIARLTTAVTSGNSVTIYRGGNNNFGYLQAQDIYAFEAILRFVQDTDVLVDFGFASDATGTVTDRIIFEFDTSVDTTIHTITEEGDVQTNNDTNTAPGVGWNVYTIIQETLGTVDFYIDDVLETTHTTNIPDTETVNAFVRVLTRSGVARSLDIDYVAFESQAFGARTS